MVWDREGTSLDRGKQKIGLFVFWLLGVQNLTDLTGLHMSMTPKYNERLRILINFLGVPERHTQSNQTTTKNNQSKS